MKVKVPRDYHQMSQSQKKRIENYIVEMATEAARKQEEHDCRVVLDLYMKMMCCVLHDAFGFGERRLVRFIANHKRVFARQNKLVSRGEQIGYLNTRMAEIFKKDGFPQQFIDDIVGEVEIVDAEERKGEQYETERNPIRDSN